jgi:uncharacterized SAM-binding protein YcdF (DUF218 family)
VFKFILVSLLVPPFGFATLALASLVLSRSWPRLGRTMLATSLICLIALGTPMVAVSMLVSLEPDTPRTPLVGAQPQAIVVLGAEVRRTKDDPPIVVGSLSLERLRTAAALQRQTALPLLVSGGTLTDGIPPVGDIMAESLIADFRVPVRWRETRSRDTWQNAAFSADILRAQGITSIYLVTHAWHMRRALQAFQRTGLTVVAAPTPADMPVGRPEVNDFIPRVSGWETSYFALHEWIGNAWYAIR